MRGSGGYRYLYATYRVRNAQSDGTAYDTERQNLTFYAVDTDGTNGTIGQTAISRLERFDGSAADASIASTFLPTGAAHLDRGSGIVASELPDVLQVLTESEANAIQALADPPSGVVDVFPYGFVVRNPSDPASRRLPANPAVGQFDGIVTFAFKVPLQASPADDPFTVSAVFLATDDDEVRLTQTAEEQTPAGLAAFDARAAALEADVLTLLPPAGDAVLRGGETVRVLCDVRVAGPEGNPTRTLSPSSGGAPWLAISPFRAMLPQDARLAAAACSSIGSANATSFAVHGFQSGRNLTGTYDGVGSSFVRAPAGPGGNFFPGEEVEVTLTTALGGTTPVVARYRVAASNGSGTFETDSTYEVGSEPWSVAMGDVDGDGDLDLVTANASSNDISVLLNHGGSFGSQSTYPVGDVPQSVALGDLDGDGDLDLVTANWGSDDGPGSISVLLNQGGGTFGTHTPYVTGDNPISVALGDLDRDGDLDLATANYGSDLASGNVSVLLNQGGGTFGTHTPYATGNNPSSVALGDLDGDGDLDLAAANNGSSEVSVLLNQGGGTLGTYTQYAVGDNPWSVAVGDVDGDGDLDLVTANNGLGSVSVLLNGGDGTLGTRTSYELDFSLNSIALGDVDKDGDLDLAITFSGVSVLVNR